MEAISNANFSKTPIELRHLGFRCCYQLTIYYSNIGYLITKRY